VIRVWSLAARLTRGSWLSLESVHKHTGVVLSGESPSLVVVLLKEKDSHNDITNDLYPVLLTLVQLLGIILV
jgi:hypothetical protein